MHSSKLTLAFLSLIVLSKLSFDGTTGLPWLGNSNEAESDGLVAEGEALERQLNDIDMRKVLMQERELLVIDRTTESDRVTEKQDSADYSEVSLEESNPPSELQTECHETSGPTSPETTKQRGAGHILTKKVLTLLRKERKRKEQERLLLLHRLYLFQKPQKMASATSFQDFLNYLKGVGRRIKDFFTKHPVDVMMQGEEDPELSHDQEQITDADEESFAQMQEIKKALMQEILLDVLKSKTRSRVTKRDVNKRGLLLQVVEGYPYESVMRSDLAYAKHFEFKRPTTTLITKAELRSSSTYPNKKSLPTLPTHTT